MTRTITVIDRQRDSGFGRINVSVNIDGLHSSYGTDGADVAVEILRKALAGEYDRCMEENEKPALAGKEGEKK
uniref:Uncharacterized protein n=1 Tax=viral metagenome TaxID=1070528 RepID=A0A6M3JFJ7_9ZZZZ